MMVKYLVIVIVFVSVFLLITGGLDSLFKRLASFSARIWRRILERL